MSKLKLGKNLIIKIVAVVVSTIMLVLSCLFLLPYPKYILLIAIILFASLGVTIPSLNPKANEALYKSLLVALGALSLFLLIFIILDITGLMDKFQSVEEVLNIIRDTGPWGVLVFILFVVFQVIALPLPAALPAVAGTALYGPTLSFIYISIGTIIGSVLSFWLGRAFGKKLVEWMIGKENTEKYADMMAKKGKPIFIMMMLFPFFPDDLICLVAGLTNMSFKFFLLAVSITRSIIIAITCYAVGGTIIPFEGWGIPVWIVIGIVCVGAMIVFYALKKKKENKEIAELDKNLDSHNNVLVASKGSEQIEKTSLQNNKINMDNNDNSSNNKK